jgi:putative membrane protein
MTLVVWTFALLAAAIFILVFVWESLLFEHPGVHGRIFGTPTADVRAVRLWAFGVGFYNLFLGCGAVAGVIMWSVGYDVVGQTLVVYVCSCMVSSGIVLLVADRLALGRERGKGLSGAVAAIVPPLIALVAAAL